MFPHEDSHRAKSRLFLRSCAAIPGCEPTFRDGTLTSVNSLFSSRSRVSLHLQANGRIEPPETITRMLGQNTGGPMWSRCVAERPFALNQTLPIGGVLRGFCGVGRG